MSANGGVVTGELIIDTTKGLLNYDKAMDHIESRSKNINIGTIGTELNKISQHTKNMSSSMDASLSSLDRMDSRLIDVSNQLHDVNTNLQNIPASGKSASGGFDGVSRSAGNASMNFRATSASLHMVKKSFGVVGIAAGVFAGLLGVTAAQSLYTVTTASMNAHYNIQKMAKGMNWNVQETQAYINKMNELQAVYKKTDMRFVASETATVARMYKLTSQQAKMAIEPVAVLTDAFIREGRTQADAMLAVKDLIDQGQGWQRRLGEVGITSQQLESVGWSGDKNDKLGLLIALQKVEEKLSLTKMAQEVYTLEDAINVLTIAGGQFLADILIPLTPMLVYIAVGFSNFLIAIKAVGAAILGFWNAIPGSAKLVIIAVAVAALAAAILLVGSYIWTVGVPALMASRGGFISYVLGVNASTISTMGFAGTLDFAFLSLVAFITGEEMATVATWSLTTALSAMAVSVLTNPIFWIGVAIIGVTVAIYELGKAWGWWNDLSSFGAAILTQLGNAWNYFVGLLYQAYDILLQVGTALYSMAMTVYNNPFGKILITIFLALMNPAYALIFVFYELGKILGWWNDIGGVGVAFWNALNIVWNSLVFAGQQVYGVMNQISGIINYVLGIPGSGDWLVDAWNRLVWIGSTLWNIIMTLAGAFGILTDAWSSGDGILGGLWNVITKIPEALAFIILSFMDWALSIDWLGIFERAIAGVEGVVNAIITFLEGFDFSVFLGGQEAGQLAGDKIVQGVQQGAEPSKFQKLFMKVAQVIAGIDWSAVLNKIMELLVRIGIVILLKLPYIAWLLISGLATAIWTGLSSINYSAIAMGFINWLVGAFARYNPITLIVSALFGENAGNMVSNSIISLFQGVGSFGSMVMGLLFGDGKGGGNIADKAASWISGINFGAVISGVISSLINTIGHYNPITLIAVLLFGPEAGAAVQTQTITFLWGMVNTFIQGFTFLYNTLTWILTGIWNIFTFTWNTIYFNAVTTWNMLYGYAVLVWNSIYGFFVWTWNGLNIIANWVWTNIFLVIWGNLLNIWNTAVWIGTSIWTTLSSAFTRVYNTIVPIFTRILGAWNGMRDGMTSTANTILNAVWGPIKALWDRLTGFWNWITHPLGGGPSGPSGGPSAGPGGYAGPGPLSSSRHNNYAGGFFGAIKEAAFNRTHELTGHRPAGGYYSGPSGLGDGNYPPECSLENPCYAGGYDFSNIWKNEALRIINAWNMSINGMSFSLKDLSQKGSLELYKRIAYGLIAPTRYEYYYNSRYSDGEALNRRAFNCFDGAEILIHLAHAMGLPASMGHTMWGNDGHAYAIISGVPFDTTALQHGYGWTAPQVRYSGPSNYTGHYSGGMKKEINLYLTFKEKVYDMPKLVDLIKQGVGEVLDEDEDYINVVVR